MAAHGKERCRVAIGTSSNTLQVREADQVLRWLRPRLVPALSLHDVLAARRGAGDRPAYLIASTNMYELHVPQWVDANPAGL